MNTEFADAHALISAVKESGHNLRNQLSLLDEARINEAPFTGSWSAGQLVNHVTKATNGLAAMLEASGSESDRGSGERIAELKEQFLDFSHKMESPEFLIPDEGPYDKAQSLAALDKAFDAIPQEAADHNLDIIVSGLPMGPISKLELLHFVLYHTVRHNHQMQGIVRAL